MKLKIKKEKMEFLNRNYFKKRLKRKVKRKLLLKKLDINKKEKRKKP